MLQDPRWPPGRRRGGWDALWLLLALLPALRPTAAICPAKCVCNDKLLQARCENSTLEVVPIQLNPEIKSLHLGNNRIISIHQTLNFYTHLNELDISFNKIKNLGTKNFEIQINLLNLNLSHNLIKQLHKDSFKGLKNLLVLDLSSNGIEEITDRTSFKDLGKLQELRLSSNNIYLIETGVFDYLIDLRRLVLSNNQLARVPETAINTLNHLTELDLDLNFIKAVAFPPNLQHLVTLRMRSNLIASLANETFTPLYHLKYLDLSDNNLTQVPTIPLSKLNYLEFLNLSLNLFSYLGPNSFLNLYKLTEIYINNISNLTKIDSKSLLDNFNLRYVSLSNNVNLKYLPKFLFLNKPHLRHVSIAGNDFSTLDASDLQLDQLETLQLGRNPLRCNCSLLWLWILKEKQVETNCSCTDHTCVDTCAEAAPKAERLAGEYSEEYSAEEESEEEKTAHFQSFTYSRDIFPIILDLDEVYCEDEERSARVQLRLAPKSDFDCTMTWVVILTIAILVTIFLFFLAVVGYMVRMRCKRKTKNPVENFINATKTYEDTHHTYYRYGQHVQNGDVFEVNKNGFPDKTSTNMYIKSPELKENISYPYTLNTFKKAEAGGTLKKACRKQPASPSGRLPECYDSSSFSINNYVSENNIYQEPFAAPALTRVQRPPHIVYV